MQRRAVVLDQAVYVVLSGLRFDRYGRDELTLQATVKRDFLHDFLVGGGMERVRSVWVEEMVSYTVKSI